MRLLFLIICIGQIFTGCKVNNSPDPGNPDEIEEFIVQAYEDKFDLSPKNPAFVYSSDFKRYTSTIYYNQSLYRLYIMDNGRILSEKTNPILPRGNIRVLSIIVDYPALKFDEIEDNLWLDAQASINVDHQKWASELNLDGPIIQFENSNLLVEPGRIVEPSKSIFQSVAIENGYNASAFDVIAFIDLDQENPSGGFAVRKADWVKLGWFYTEDEGKELSYEKLRGIAYGIYHHEIGHLFGWDHEWSDTGEGDLFITDPKLFGWADIDEDGIVEIFDPKPYGID